MFSSSCGCGFLINSCLAGSVAIARAEAISSVVLPVALHYRVITGSENGWVFFFCVCVVFLVVGVFLLFCRGLLFGR